MKFLLLAALVASALANYVPVTRYCPLHETFKDEYIVRFHPKAVREFEAFKARPGAYQNLKVNEFSSYMGFSATLSEQQLAEVQKMDGVLSIEPNSKVYALGVQTGVQAWGIDRSDQVDLPLNQTYFWNDDSDGSGVQIFVLDTGILTTHPDFEGRAKFEADCTGTACQTTDDTGDAQGHGTHCAGTAASTTYGIAKGATVHNVRCLNAFGTGSFAGIINSIEFVTNFQTTSTKIISMSLGGGFNTAMNAAVDAAFDANVLSVIAAGNSNNDACTISPASAEHAFTVAASDIRDRKASFSSFGQCVNLYAPGVNILSTANNGGTQTQSGTSMACPHVAGAAALVASRGVAQAAEIARILEAEATPDKIEGNRENTPNLLLFTAPVRR